MTNDQNKIALNTLYLATEGEGIRIGTPQIFVRLQGCPVGCVNCDSKETWSYPKESFKYFEEIVERVEAISNKSNPPVKRISITGGEPLAPKNSEGTLRLVRHFKNHGYFINLETSGVYFHQEIFDHVDFISIDYKTLSTKVNFKEEILIKTIKDYSHKMQVKAVLEDENDFNQYWDFYQRVEGIMLSRKIPLPPFCATPCYNLKEEFPLERFHKILNLNEKKGGPFRFIGQQHKWMFGPDVKDV